MLRVKTQKQFGFTLIELVATIIVIGVLSVTVLPRFSDRSGMAEYALRDEMASLAQHAQQRAMFDHSGACYSLSIQADRVEAQRDGIIIDDYAVATFDEDYDGLGASAATNNLYFDDLGNLLTGGADCASAAIPDDPVSINVTGGIPISLVIYPTGYVQRQG